MQSAIAKIAKCLVSPFGSCTCICNCYFANDAQHLTQRNHQQLASGDGDASPRINPTRVQRVCSHNPRGGNSRMGSVVGRPLRHVGGYPAASADGSAVDTQEKDQASASSDAVPSSLSSSSREPERRVVVESPPGLLDPADIQSRLDQPGHSVGGRESDGSHGLRHGTRPSYYRTPRRKHPVKE